MRLKTMVLLVSSSLILSGCSLGTIKLIEPLSQIPPDEWTSNSIPFKKWEVERYLTYDAPVYDIADVNTEPMTNGNIGDKVEIVGVSKEKDFVAIKIDEQEGNNPDHYKYIEMMFISSSSSPATDEELIAVEELMEQKKAEEERKAKEEAERLAKEEEEKKAAEEVARIAEEERKAKEEAERLAKEEEEKKAAEEAARIAEEERKAEEESLSVIKFPTNPSTVEVIGGITFASVDVTGVVRADAVVYSAPNINEYDKIKDLKKDAEVKVIAVGSNGFLKIQMEDGIMGFVDTKFIRDKSIETPKPSE